MAVSNKRKYVHEVLIGWSAIQCFCLGQIKKINVFRVTHLKILGRVGTHFFPLEKKVFLCILKGILPFKMHKIIFFPENLNFFTTFHQ